MKHKFYSHPYLCILIILERLLPFTLELIGRRKIATNSLSTLKKSLNIRIINRRFNNDTMPDVEPVNEKLVKIRKLFDEPKIRASSESTISAYLLPRTDAHQVSLIYLFSLFSSHCLKFYVKNAIIYIFVNVSQLFFFFLPRYFLILLEAVEQQRSRYLTFVLERISSRS